MDTDRSEFFFEARQVARRAGEIVREGFGSVHKIEFKGQIDLVTDYDRKSEEHILSHLQDRFPRHSFHGEESGLISGNSTTRYKWFIDPIDGTTNFAHGVPFFAVSIALLEDGHPIIAVVFDPLRSELFAAVRGYNSTLNGEPIRVSTTSNLNNALLATGFPYDVRISEDNNLYQFNRLTRSCQGVRRLGSAALDLCYTACGRLDGYWELRLHPWDMAAGGLIVQAAAGTTTDIDGAKDWLKTPSIVASNGHLHSQLLGTLTDRTAN